MALRTPWNVHCQTGKKTHAIWTFEDLTLYTEGNRSKTFCSKLSCAPRICWAELWLIIVHFKCRNGYIRKGIVIFIPFYLVPFLVGIDMLLFYTSDQRHKVGYLLLFLYDKMKYAAWLGKNSMFILVKAKTILDQYWKMFRKSKPSDVKSDLIWDSGNSLVKE